MSRPPYKPDDFAKGETPKFPLLQQDIVWVVGWDIPWNWCIDSDKVPYADYGAHGCSMKKTTFDELIRELEGTEEFEASRRVRALIGRKPALTPWMVAALKAGWTPPPGFKREDYE